MINEARRYRTAINGLVRRVKAFAKQRGVTLEHASKLVFSDRRKIDWLANGGSLKPETFDQAVKKLEALESENASQREDAA